VAGEVQLNIFEQTPANFDSAKVNNPGIRYRYRVSGTGYQVEGE
jgi:hypothetical protein